MRAVWKPFMILLFSMKTKGQLDNSVTTLKKHISIFDVCALFMFTAQVSSITGNDEVDIHTFVNACVLMGGNGRCTMTYHMLIVYNIITASTILGYSIL